MNMKFYRQRANLTQQQLAEMVGCTQGTIAHYESGWRRPGFKKAVKIANALNMPIEHVRPELFEEHAA